MPVHVVTGTDEGRVSEEAASLFEELKAPGSDDFSNEIIEGVADNAEDAFQKCSQTIEALQTLGLFAVALFRFQLEQDHALLLLLFFWI